MRSFFNGYGAPALLLCVAASTVCAMASTAAAQQSAAPHDKYAYLTPQLGEKALAWVKQQTDATRAKLEASPNFKGVLGDMQAVHANQVPLPAYHMLGAHRYIRFEHNQAHPYGRFQVSEAGADGRPAGTWQTVFDLDDYNKGKPKPYTVKWTQPEKECLAPDYDRCMIPLYFNGGQNNAYVELDLKSRRVVEDGFSIPPGRNMAAWLDRNTLLVAHTTGGVRVMPSQFPAELHLWKRGTPLAQAPKIFEIAPTDSLFEYDVIGAPGKRQIILTVAKTYTNFQLKTLSVDGQVRDLPLPAELNNFGSPHFTEGRLAVQLATPQTVNGKLYPADTILAYDFASQRVSVVMVPPKDVYLSGGLTGTREGIAVVGVHNLQRTLYLATPKGDGWAVKLQMTEPAGTTLQIDALDTSNAVLLHEQGLASPPRIRYLNHGQQPVLVDSATPEADLAGYIVEIKSARAADGVSVDYYLMHKTGSHTGPTPTILQGYGGFGVSNDPSYFCCHFGASWKSWFDRGGALAVAAVRGGGERGGAWHLAGAGAHKKTMFDDFNAVAQNLESSGFTDRAHLGITGHSNGGVLTSGAVVMRPDLYGAAVIGAPVADFSIVGHGDGGIGAGMKTEFGSWDDPADRPIMQTWDPFYNIKTGVTYPPMLVVVATTDNQVGPSHSRRFVAKMQDVGAPALLLEGSEGGHDYPDEYTQTADMAMQMSFFIDALMKH